MRWSSTSKTLGERNRGELGGKLATQVLGERLSQLRLRADLIGSSVYSRPTSEHSGDYGIWTEATTSFCVSPRAIRNVGRQ